MPEPHRRAIDVVRSKLDARQHALIPAHVTACREDEVPDWSLVSRLLQALRRVRVTLEFAEPVELPGGGVILPVSDGTDEFDALRRYVLGGFDGPVRIHRPHITLLHPRHAAGSVAAAQDPTCPPNRSFPTALRFPALRGWRPG